MMSRRSQDGQFEALAASQIHVDALCSRLWTMINVLIFASKPSLRRGKNLPKLPHAMWSISSETQLWADFPSGTFRRWLSRSLPVPCLSKSHRTAGESIGQPLILIMWIWCRRDSPEQKKCFALSLSSICVSSLDVWRLWITWFYRLINGGDFRQRLLEHETQSRARKSPDVDIDQSVRYSQHIDLSAWSGIFTWRFWPNLLRGHYVCSIGWFSNIVAMDKFTS